MYPVLIEGLQTAANYDQSYEDDDCEPLHSLNIQPTTKGIKRP